MTRDTDEVSHLRTQKWIMLATGQWEFEKYDKPLLFLYRFYSRFIFWYSLYYMLVSMASTYLYWDCDKRMIELILCVGVSTDNLLVMFLSKYYNLKKILKRILDFEKALQQDQVEEREIYYKRARLNNKLNWLIISCMGFCVVYYYIEAMRNSFTLVETEACPVTKLALYPTWHVSKNYFFVLLSDILYLPFTTCILAYKITVILSMITFTLGQIDILHYNIRNLDNDAEKIQKELDVNFKEAVEIVVKMCVVKHQELNQLMETIQSSTKVFVLLLYFNMSAEIAFLCIQCLLVKSFEEILLHTSMVATMTIQNFVFYKYADDLITESAAISDVIYNNTNWISYSRTVQKNLQLMMIRSRKILSLNAAMVGDMTLETFTKLMKLCYSIVTFFKTAYDF